MSAPYLPFPWHSGYEYTLPRQTADAAPSAAATDVTATPANRFRCCVCGTPSIDKVFEFAGREFRTCLSCYRLPNAELLSRGRRY